MEVANSRGPESLAALAGETGARPVTVEEAAGADLVVIAIPLKAVPGLPAALLTGKVVVDANNYYPARDGQIAPIDGGTTSTRWVADHLRGARLVKAFNTMQAQHLLEDGRPSGADDRLALPVASDDEDAKRAVSALVDDLGFDPVDGGDLDGKLAPAAGRANLRRQPRCGRNVRVPPRRRAALTPSGCCGRPRRTTGPGSGAARWPPGVVSSGSARST